MLWHLKSCFTSAATSIIKGVLSLPKTPAKSLEKTEKHENNEPARLQKIVGEFLLVFCRELLQDIWREFCRIFLQNKVGCKISWPFSCRKPPALTSIGRGRSAANPKTASLVSVGVLSSALSCTRLRVPPVALHVSQLISWILKRFAGVAPVSRYIP